MRTVESASLAPSTTASAVFRSDESFTAEFRNGPGLWADLAHALLPDKPGAAFREHTRGSERQCYAWAGGYNEPLASTLVDLLRSPEGARVLDVVMRGSDAPWWEDHQHSVRLAAAAERAKAILNI